MKLYRTKIKDGYIDMIQYRKEDLVDEEIFKTDINFSELLNCTWTKERRRLMNRIVSDYLDYMLKRIIDGDTFSFSNLLDIRIASINNKHMRHYRYNTSTFGEVYKPVIEINKRKRGIKYNVFYFMKVLGRYRIMLKQQIDNGKEYGRV